MVIASGNISQSGGGTVPGTVSIPQPSESGIQDELYAWIAEGNTIEAYNEYYGLTLEQVKESQQTVVDISCREYIYSYWSKEAQSNAALGLLEESEATLCKQEIGDVLAENVGFIEDIEALTSIAEIDTYVANITRMTITGGQ